jgi:hypothetical protein
MTLFFIRFKRANLKTTTKFLIAEDRYQLRGANNAKTKRRQAQIYG